jgi:uncharacterized protein
MKIGRTGQRSGDLIDRRGQSSGVSGMSLPIPMGAKGGIPAILMLLVALFFGGRAVLDGGADGTGVGSGGLDRLPGAAPATGANRVATPDPDAEMVEFVSFVLDDIQGFWRQQFAQTGRTYTPAKLVLFEDATRTACGTGEAGMGPFYCPADQQVYIDLGFFRELSERYKAPGDFAPAYVIAHEIAHHIQTLTGISENVSRQSQGNRGKANELSVRQELQADCLAGVWAHSTYERGLLESGDLEEGLNAAAAVGDDRLQRQAGGRVNPETWTHGSSEQRMKWFRRGFDSGNPNQCDTFSGSV